MKSFNNSDLLLTERYGSMGEENIYVDKANKVVRVENQKQSFSKSVVRNVGHAVKSVFLPHGYPDSVSDDYFEYQVWDTVQAFCSTITGTFTTQSILKGVGVGNSEATPLAAAVTWILKDGSGMIGRITFAWWKGNVLDADCKQWRLFADVLNDMAIFLEFLLPLFFNISIQILCVTSIMKAIVGVAGGATRASITQHQAIRGNMADVSAKDASQETCVNLIASLIGIFLLTFFENNQVCQWVIFMMSTIIHIFANYCAVRSLVFNHLNKTRLICVMKTYLKYDTVPSPIKVNLKEPLMMLNNHRVRDMCGYEIKLGSSLKDILSIKDVGSVRVLLDVFSDREYLIVPDLKKRVLYIALSSNASSVDIITAYFNATMLGIALCHFNKIDLNINEKRQLRHVTPLQRLQKLMKTFPMNNAVQPFIFPLEKFIAFQEFVNGELLSFFTAMNVNGWDASHHSLDIGEWKCNFNATKSGKID